MVRVGVRYTKVVGAVVFLLCAGCGSDSRPQAAAATVPPDDLFEGAFVSKSFECMTPDGKTTSVERTNELHRKIYIVADRVLIQDRNSVECLRGETRRTKTGLGDVRVVSRNFEVSSRTYAAVGDHNEMTIVLATPTSGKVHAIAETFEGRALTDGNFHPVTAQLKNVENEKWIYSYGGGALHVFQMDAPASICSGAGAALHVTYEPI